MKKTAVFYQSKGKQLDANQTNKSRIGRYLFDCTEEFRLLTEMLEKKVHEELSQKNNQITQLKKIVTEWDECFGTDTYLKEQSEIKDTIFAFNSEYLPNSISMTPKQLFNQIQEKEKSIRQLEEKIQNEKKEHMKQEQALHELLNKKEKKFEDAQKKHIKETETNLNSLRISITNHYEERIQQMVEENQKLLQKLKKQEEIVLPKLNSQIESMETIINKQDMEKQNLIDQFENFQNKMSWEQEKQAKPERFPQTSNPARQNVKESSSKSKKLASVLLKSQKKEENFAPQNEELTIQDIEEEISAEEHKEQKIAPKLKYSSPKPQQPSIPVPTEIIIEEEFIKTLKRKSPQPQKEVPKSREIEEFEQEVIKPMIESFSEQKVKPVVVANKSPEAKRVSSSSLKQNSIIEQELAATKTKKLQQIPEFTQKKNPSPKIPTIEKIEIEVEQKEVPATALEHMLSFLKENEKKCLESYSKSKIKNEVL